MELKEFVEQQRQLLDDFVADYERQRKRKQLTMIRPLQQWKELYDDFKEIYDPTEAEDHINDNHRRESDSGSPVRTSESLGNSDGSTGRRKRAA